MGIAEWSADTIAGGGGGGRGGGGLSDFRLILGRYPGRGGGEGSSFGWGVGSDVLERPYTVGGGGGVPPLTPPTSSSLDPPPLPPLPMFEADSQKFCFGAFSAKRT